MLKVYGLLLCFALLFSSSLRKNKKRKFFVMGIFLKFRKKTNLSLHSLSILILRLHSQSHTWKHEYSHINIHTHTAAHTPIWWKFFLLYICFQRLLSYGCQLENILIFTDLVIVIRSFSAKAKLSGKCIVVPCFVLWAPVLWPLHSFKSKDVLALCRAEVCEIAHQIFNLTVCTHSDQ